MILFTPHKQNMSILCRTENINWENMYSFLIKFALVSVSVTHAFFRGKTIWPCPCALRDNTMTQNLNTNLMLNKTAKNIPQLWKLYNYISQKVISTSYWPPTSYNSNFTLSVNTSWSRKLVGLGNLTVHPTYGSTSHDSKVTLSMS